LGRVGKTGCTPSFPHQDRPRLSRSPRIRLEVEIAACLASEFPGDLPQRRKENYETKMVATGRYSAVTVGVVGAPSSGIELVRCKNGPQVSIDDIKYTQ
jgi:hypothetical protein